MHVDVTIGLDVEVALGSHAYVTGGKHVEVTIGIHLDPVVAIPADDVDASSVVMQQDLRAALGPQADELVCYVVIHHELLTLGRQHTKHRTDRVLALVVSLVVAGPASA